MGIGVLVLGESGSGKSTALRNYDEDEVGIFNVANKPLPFKKKLKVAKKANYESIMAGIAKSPLKSFVIDDSQCLLSFELFSKAKEQGYGKFTQIALNFYNLLRFIIDEVAPDKIVYFLHHCETTEFGKVKAKTVGKMLDNQLCVEGQFAIVLLCKTDGKSYWFETQSDGFSTAKSPMEMFEQRIDNDLKLVDTKIREYWEL